MKFLKIDVIGVSMSKPHTSELNSRTIQWKRTCTAYKQYARDLTTCTYIDTVIVALLFRIRAVLLLVASEHKCKIKKTGYDAGPERTREGWTWSRDNKLRV